MEADHYCADCDTHFRADPEQHAETYHGGGLFRGVINGGWRSFERKHTDVMGDLSDR